MQPRIIQPENIPEGAFAFCYIDEMERQNAIRQNRPFPLNPTCEYFTAIKRSGGSMEGYLGRTDRPSIYFNAPERGITYFNDLDDGKTLYFTNNGRDLFCLKHIIPGKPMDSILKLLTIINLPSCLYTIPPFTLAITAL